MYSLVVNQIFGQRLYSDFGAHPPCGSSTSGNSLLISSLFASGELRPLTLKPVRASAFWRLGCVWLENALS